jgi:hypothetical protein
MEGADCIANIVDTCVAKRALHSQNWTTEIEEGKRTESHGRYPAGPKTSAQRITARQRARPTVRVSGKCNGIIIPNQRLAIVAEDLRTVIVNRRIFTIAGRDSQEHSLGSLAKSDVGRIFLDSVA